jgi:hypothetical protein
MCFSTSRKVAPRVDIGFALPRLWITSGLPTILELASSIATRAFLGTNLVGLPTSGLLARIVSEWLVIRPESVARSLGLAPSQDADSWLAVVFRLLPFMLQWWATDTLSTSCQP